MAAEQNKQNLQDVFLNSVRKSGMMVTIHITNGFMIKNAVIISFDNYAILAESDGKQMLIYKHAVSTITPDKKVELNRNTENV